jgi:preprotein translocase subunit SecF
MRLLKIVPDNTNLPFVSLRKWAFGLTILLSVAALALVFTRGLNLGVDFVGGLMIEEKFASPPSLDKLRTTIDNLELGEARLQTVGNDNTIRSAARSRAN